MTVGASTAVIAALLVAGCSSNGDGGSTEPPTSSPAAPVTSETTRSAPSTAAVAGPGPDADLATTTFPVDLDRALAVADQTVPGGTVTKIELEYERSDNTWVYKIDTQVGTEQRELRIDAQSAQVIRDDRDRESDNPVAVDPRRLTPMDAAARATDLVPGSVASWSLEFDDDRQRYSFDIRTANGTEDVDVDVDSGAATRD
ncbi:PepSY domain-containing protein [Mycolicibacterium tokaiense]|uniref:Peptidase propeptide and YPEB domain n=1 Tax=Mycolicibacterium tokaiense TaxID=39695 RepID=A0A378TII5_9MYCO|nr:PepSY domain-containing protein [Mycolicibacterium tokaiense]BBY84872.1 hypothetical protein MTOK_06540 [Mycolicibacterium tokaiense]STZ60622.1 Peptidase propeptide and YPEB domain [Mycolicibacterium tokaiense]